MPIPDDDPEVVDPISALAEPRLSDGPEVRPEPDPNQQAPRATVKRTRARRKSAAEAAGLVPVDIPCATCSHLLQPDMKFCPECGTPVPVPVPPGKCRFGHDVGAEDKFCAMCGAQLGPLTPAEHEPKDPAQMSEHEMRSYEAAHQRAVILGQENPVTAYAPGQAPPGVKTVVIHFLVDGVSAFGNVWMRGQEIEVWPGHPRWREASGWITLDMAGQFQRFGRQIFGPGPWPGVKTYTAGVGRFAKLGVVGGEGFVPEPTEEELRRADEAERVRGRRVPMPLG